MASRLKGISGLSTHYPSPLKSIKEMRQAQKIVTKNCATGCSGNIYDRHDLGSLGLGQSKSNAGERIAYDVNVLLQWRGRGTVRNVSTATVTSVILTNVERHALVKYAALQRHEVQTI
jgi:hypothetical protein